VVKEELNAIKEKYGDQRRTKIIASSAKNISVEDMIPDVDNVLVFTAGGYVKRTDPGEYRKQRRGGVGVVDLDTKEEDAVTELLFASTHTDLLFFTDRGRVFKIKMYELPEGRRATKGKSIMNFLQLEAEEKVTSILPMPADVKKNQCSLFMVTRHGVVKKVDAASFHEVRRSGLIAISLSKGDMLIDSFFVQDKDEVILVSEKGQSIRFSQKDVRQMGRSAGGVTGMKLKKGDFVVNGRVILEGKDDNCALFVLSENGYGKKTPLSEYSAQKRGGSGLKTANITAKTGDIVAASILDETTEEVIAMSRKSQTIRIDVAEIPSQGRSTQGVKIMRLRAGDKVASLIKI